MDEPLMLDVAGLVRMHDAYTEQWHVASGFKDKTTGIDASLEAVIEAQHRANFDLWHQEDEARNPGATDEQITAVKRAIDRLNQRRNDLVEAMDGVLFRGLAQNVDAPLHSETPGMMIDRMSIMALKIFHTREETMRPTASEAHRDKNLFRLSVLMEQRADLAGCLDSLLTAVQAGERRFKIYRQMKMYNDPELNPVLYRQAGK